MTPSHTAALNIAHVATLWNGWTRKMRKSGTCSARRPPAILSPKSETKNAAKPATAAKKVIKIVSLKVR
jgi:hypothetical protein